MALSRTLSVQVVGDVKGLRSSLGDAGKQTESFGSKLKGMGKVAGVAAGGAALGAVVGVLKSSLGAAMEAEKAQFRLTQAFKSQKVPLQKQKAAMEAVNKVSKQAALDDEDLSDVLARLTRSTGSVEDATKGMALAAEIARGRNVSLEVASKAVEKAYLGQETGLKRLGVVVPKYTENQEAAKVAIDTFKESMKGLKGAQLEAAEATLNDLELNKKQAVELDKRTTATNALDKATQQFANSSKAYGETAAGAQERVAVAVENLQEKIGQKLLPVWVKLMELLLRVVEWTERNWPRFEQEISKGIQKVRQAIEKIQPIIDGWVKQFEGFFKIIKGIFTGDWDLVWEGVKLTVEGTFEKIRETLRLQVELLGKLALKIGEAIKDGIVAGLKGLKDLIVGVLKSALNAYIGLFNTIIGRINSALEIKIPLPFGQSININPPDVPKIPELALGGIVRRPTLALIGEAGPEAVVPLNRAGGGMGPTVVKVFLDGREIASAAFPHLRSVNEVHLRRNAATGLA